MTTTSITSRSARRMGKAASAFLAALDTEGRAHATFEFGSDERYSWHYTPRPRNGLPRKDMAAPQLEAAEALMGSSVSKRGLEKVRAIIQHELILARAERPEGTSHWERDTGLYFFSVFGDPYGSEPWGWRVDGHHLSLHFTMANGDVISSTPAFFGANPAEVKDGPEKGLRILAEEEDLARRLFMSLDASQTAKAVIYPVAPADLITRASRRVEIAEPAGLPAELMSAGQRDALMSLVQVYLQRTTPEVAARTLRKIEGAGVSNICFAWAGSASRGQGHYYRIHGPNFFAEYDNTQNMANHVHSVWRSVEGDFGLDVLRAHYDQHHT